MVDSVSVSSGQGAAYTWSGATFEWNGTASTKTWATAYLTSHSVSVSSGFVLVDARKHAMLKALVEQLPMSERLARAMNMAWTRTLSLGEASQSLVQFVRNAVEGLTLLDQKRRQVTKDTIEPLRVQELLARSFVLPKTEQLALQEQAQQLVSFLRAFVHSFAFADATASTFIKNAIEDLNVHEVLSRLVGMARTDGLILGDAHGQVAAFVRTANEGLAFSEQEKVAFAKQLVHELNLGEVGARDVSKPYSEHWSMGETYVDLIAYLLRLIEAFALTDSRVNEIEKVHEEMLSTADVLKRDATLHKADVFALVETYTDLISYLLRVAESIGLLERLGNSYLSDKAEGFSLLDRASRIVSANLHEAFAFADTLGRTIAFRRNLAEGLQLQEALGKASGISLEEALELVEQYRRHANGVISDMIVGEGEITQDDFLQILQYGHPPGYTDFRDFMPGDYEYQNALFRAVLSSNNADRGYINKLSVTVDVPDVFDRGTAQITDPANGVSVTFARRFHLPPEVTLTYKGGSAVAVPRIFGNVDIQGFTAVLEDTAGARVTGSVSWVAQGY